MPVTDPFSTVTRTVIILTVQLITASTAAAPRRPDGPCCPSYFFLGGAEISVIVAIRELVLVLALAPPLRINE